MSSYFPDAQTTHAIFSEARSEILRLACCGEARAGLIVAKWHLEEKSGAPRSAERALEILIPLASDGMVDAQLTLADIATHGSAGAAVDEPAAFSWKLEAAKQGHFPSMRSLSLRYANGYGGCAIDLDESERWKIMKVDAIRRRHATEAKTLNLFGRRMANYSHIDHRNRTPKWHVHYRRRPTSKRRRRDSNGTL